MDFLLSVYFWNSSSRHKGEHGQEMWFFHSLKVEAKANFEEEKFMFLLQFLCWWNDDMHGPKNYKYCKHCMLRMVTSLANKHPMLCCLIRFIVWLDGDQQCMSVSKEISNVGLLLNLCMLMWIMWKTFVRWWAVARFSQLGSGLRLEDCVYIKTFYSTFFKNHIYSVW